MNQVFEPSNTVDTWRCQCLAVTCFLAQWSWHWRHLYLTPCTYWTLTDFDWLRSFINVLIYVTERMPLWTFYIWRTHFVSLWQEIDMKHRPWFLSLVSRTPWNDYPIQLYTIIYNLSCWHLPTQWRKCFWISDLRNVRFFSRTSMLFYTRPKSYCTPISKCSHLMNNRSVIKVKIDLSDWLSGCPFTDIILRAVTLMGT